MKIIRASQQIIDPENNRIHEQSIQIDLSDNFVTIKHNGDELAMSLKNFFKFTEMNHAVIQEAQKEMYKSYPTGPEFPKDRITKR